jgi:putative transposase
MPQVYYRLFYHATWKTHLGEPLITPAIEKVLYPFLDNKAKRFDCILHSIGGTENHIHIAITIPPAESVSDIIGKLRDSSSYFLNKEIQVTENFAWQDGFGVLSFAERDLHSVTRYIQNQKEHHADGKMNTEMERIENNQPHASP